MRYFYVAAALLLAGGVSAAEVKRWIDDEGLVHFGDQAPPAVAAEVRQIDDSAPGVDNGGGLRPGELDMVKRYERRARELEDAKMRSARALEKGRLSAEQQQKRQARCRYYRARLDQSRAKKRQGYSRGEGERLDDQIELNEMKVAIYCD